MIAGPSGAGKSRLLQAVYDWMDDEMEDFHLIPSHTTRPPRPDETVDGSYRHITEQAFVAGVEQGGVAEYDIYKGHYYGTLLSHLDEDGIGGKAITVPGLSQILAAVPRRRVVAVRVVLDRSELAERLRGRGETEEFIATRLEDVPENGMDWESDFEPHWDLTLYNNEGLIDIYAAALGTLLVLHEEYLEDEGTG